MAHLFVYGSLVLAAARAGGEVVELRDHVRDWSVAMDNRLTLPGYKHYLQQGRRPDCHVAFLNVVPRRGGSVNGVLLPVDPDAQAAYDDRERSYERVEVTDLIEPAVPGPVRTYVASAAGRRRYEQACERGDGLVHEAYRDAVVAAFAALGEEQLARFRTTTRPPPFPVVPLERREIPADPGVG